MGNRIDQLIGEAMDSGRATSYEVDPADFGDTPHRWLLFCSCLAMLMRHRSELRISLVGSWAGLSQFGLSTLRYTHVHGRIIRIRHEATHGATVRLVFERVPVKPSGARARLNRPMLCNLAPPSNSHIDLHSQIAPRPLSAR